MLLTLDGRRFFLPVDQTVKLAPVPQITRVPGAARELLGLALCEGLIVPVLEVGMGRDVMVVCLHQGEPIGLVGAVEIQTGLFRVGEAGGVLVAGELVPPLDLGEICGQVQAGAWGASWGG
jgi:hypothetical protein